MNLRPFAESASEGWSLYCGDSRNVLGSVPYLGADIIVTDPPYAISKRGAKHVGVGTRGTRRLDFFEGDDDFEAMTSTVIDVLRLAVDHCTEKASAYVWCGHRMVSRICDLFEELGRSTRLLAWRKKCPVPLPPTAGGYPSEFEICVYAYPRGRHWNGRSATWSIIEADGYRHGQPGKVDHPTQKPIAVIAPLLENSCPSGGTVLDPFAGSGTTIVAARDRGLRAVGIEKERRYCAVAASRLAQSVLPLSAEFSDVLG